MGRHKIFTEEQLKLNKSKQNIANYNRIIAGQTDRKRFNRTLEMLERYLLGVEKLNKTNENKIAVDINRMEQLLKKAKAINFAVKIEESVRKMMAAESVVEKSEEEEMKEPSARKIIGEGKVIDNKADKIIIVRETVSDI
jgi:endonuclease III